MQQDVLLSVIVPCRNVARWLKRCLDEIFAALPENAEVIAVDDGSTDSTASILSAAALADSRVSLIRQENRGVSAARNAALDAARGKYVFFVDPDDGVESDFFAPMVRAMEKENADYCICGYRRRNDLSDDFRDVHLKEAYDLRTNAEIVSRYLPRIFGYSFDDVRRWYRGEPLFARREMAGVWRAAFRLEIIRKFGIHFDETITLYEDAMFNAEYLVRSSRLVGIDRPLYRVTVREGSLMRSVPQDKALYAANKLRLLERRKAIDAIAGGALFPLYAASNVFSAMELLRLGRFNELCLYLRDETVGKSFAGFPLSPRHPLVALSFFALRPVLGLLGCGRSLNLSGK